MLRTSPYTIYFDKQRRWKNININRWKITLQPVFRYIRCPGHMTNWGRHSRVRVMEMRQGETASDITRRQRDGPTLWDVRATSDVHELRIKVPSIALCVTRHERYIHRILVTISAVCPDVSDSSTFWKHRTPWKRMDLEDDRHVNREPWASVMKMIELDTFA